MRRYEASMYDSNRWDGFELRPGDIIISTPPKWRLCGMPHNRHTTALHLLQSGVELNVIKSWLGHVSITTTSQYINSRELHQPDEKPQVSRSRRCRNSIPDFRTAAV